MPDKKLLGAAAFVAALAGGGVAGALLGTPLTSSAQTDDTTEAVDEESAGDETIMRFGDVDPAFGRGGGCVGGGRHADLDVAAEALGMTEDELRDALDDGSTLADVAEAQGVDVQTVIDALVAAATERIDDAVADGDLAEDRAAEIREDLVENMTDLVNGELKPIRHLRHHGGAIIVLDAAAEALGMTDDELRDALEDGSTIAEVAEAEGVDVQTVIDALVAAATERIDDAVADGDLAEDRAAEIKEDLEERITEIVDEGPRLRHRGFGPGLAF